MQPQRPHMGLQHGIKRNLGRTWAVEISANTFGKNEFHELQNFYPHFFQKVLADISTAHVRPKFLFIPCCRPVCGLWGCI